MDSPYLEAEPVVGNRTPTTGGLLHAARSAMATRLASVFVKDVRDFTALPPERIGAAGGHHTESWFDGQEKFSRARSRHGSGVAKPLS
jgi:hypothetical protein